MGSRPAKRATRGRLAQLVRAPALHAGGQRFESSTAHHSFSVILCKPASDGYPGRDVSFIDKSLNLD